MFSNSVKIGSLYDSLCWLFGMLRFPDCFKKCSLLAYFWMLQMALKNEVSRHGGDGWVVGRDDFTDLFQRQ